MLQRITGRKRALIGLTALALLALTAAAPVASAQIPLVPDSPVQLPGGGGGGGGADSGGSSGGGLVDTVGEVVDTTTDTVGNVGSGTTDAVGNVGGGVTEGVGGAGEKIVEGTKKTVENVTRDTGNTVNETVGNLGGTVDGLGGNVQNPLLNVKSPLDLNKDGKISPKERNRTGGGTTTKREAALKTQLAAERREDRLADAKLASLLNAEKKSRDAGASAPVAIAPPPRETFITQLADAAKEAAEKLAFPLGLALMVGAFLMVQGRIDRKDAKLALAPIDSEQDLLRFQ